MESTSQKFRLKNLFFLTAIGLIVCILSTLPAPWNDPINNASLNLLFKIRGSRQLSENIVMVYIGDEDIKAINNKGWPISRDYYGYLIYIFNHFGAKVIGIDVLFSTEDRLYPEYDEVLVDALRSNRNVCLPMVFSELSFDQPLQNNLSNHLPQGYSPSFPIRLFQKDAAGIGFSNFDHETIINRAPLVAISQDTFFLSFGCELARLYLGVQESVRILPKAIQLIDTLGNQHTFPTDQWKKLRLNHFGDINNISALSLVDLLKTYEANPDSLNFKDKIVIIAITAPGIMKVASTPLSPALPATLIHVTVLENLINQNYLNETPIFVNWIIILLMVAIAWLLFQIQKKAYFAIAIVAVLLGFWSVSLVGFCFWYRIIPIFYPTLAFVLTMSYVAFRKNIERRLDDYALKVLLNDQIRTKESQLEAARTKLVELQTQLNEETIITEQIEKLALERENTIRKLEKELRDLQAFIIPSKPKLEFAEIIFSENSKMADVLALVATVSRDDIPVLISGETGTGKEMIARAIHKSSKRNKAPFVAINCGALSETLLESELFGHEKGSFTGAHSSRRGRFELANGGTIFLDEITETSPAFQTRLLRVLQESSFERLGGEQTIKVDVRIIAATNKDVQVEMENSRFRADLFYRLNGFPITIPPLRERQDDIPLLALHFLKKYNYRTITRFSDRAMEILKNHPWPGNVRELENIVRRAAILAQAEQRNMIRESNLPEEIQKSKPTQMIYNDYRSLEDQILAMLRTFEFSRSAITQTAKALGNKDRGTITEYFRGICFENLVNADFNINEATKVIANTTDEAIFDRVKAKINEYLKNLQIVSTDFAINELKPDNLPSAFKGLPKKYHTYLQQVLENIGKITH